MRIRERSSTIFLASAGSILALVAACTAAIGAPQQLEDYTDRIKLSPGMVILYPISKGLDQACHPLPAHKMVIVIEANDQQNTKDQQNQQNQKDQSAYSFKWSMTEPLNASGVRAVDPSDARNSHKVSFYYVNGQDCTMSGYITAVRISDAQYRELKLSGSTEFETDGPYAPLTRGVSSVRLPHSLKKVGEESLPLNIDEQQVSVRTIKAQTDNGWKFWILDNIQAPMILKGDGPVTWDVPLISMDMPKQEGNRLVRDLKKKGLATTNLINFDKNSAKLRPTAKPILNQIAQYLKENQTVKLELQGHTCTIGPYKYNMDLSRKRAQAVKNYLVSQHIDPARLSVVGFGYNRPIASNNTAAGQCQEQASRLSGRI